MNEYASRVRVLTLWDILVHNSSEEHPLKTNDIIELLTEHGLYCDRRTVYGDIDLLREVGYDICKTHNGRNNEYYTPNILSTDSMQDILQLIENSDHNDEKKSLLRLQFINTFLH